MMEKMLIGLLVSGSVALYAADYVSIKEDACNTMYTYNKNYIREVEQMQVYAKEIKIEYNPLENLDLEERCGKSIEEDYNDFSGSLNINN